MFIKLLNVVYDTLFPRCCILCGDLSYCDRDLCLACEKDLPSLSNGCEQCALPLPTENTNSKLCAHCLKSPPPYHCTLSLFHYEKPIRRLISSLKFHNQLGYAKLFSSLLLEKISSHYQNTQQWPEAIIPVPLHPKRLRQRGFNQALEIAKPISKRLKIPLDISHCHRVLATAGQTTLPADLRPNNVYRAFKIT
ncbi:MAG: ComF family protein, partial [Proteobacteria bacterium]|nr:ComF family protein [Pseudomonadota bacterium]